MNILTANRKNLETLHAQLTAEYARLRGLGLKLDMSRGKPARDQLDLCEPMLTVLSHNDQMQDGKTDVRNYGAVSYTHLTLPTMACWRASPPAGRFLRISWRSRWKTSSPGAAPA